MGCEKAGLQSIFFRDFRGKVFHSGELEALSDTLYRGAETKPCSYYTDCVKDPAPVLRESDGPVWNPEPGLELMEHEERSCHQTAKSGKVVPVQTFPKVEDAEHTKHGKGNDLLNHF